MVYRITVLSFLHPALMSDHWLLSALNITQNSFPKGADVSPPPLMKALQIRDRAGSRVFFFLSSSVDNSPMWPPQNGVHVPRGREKRIKTGAERKHVTRVSAFFACILSPTSACYFSAFPHNSQRSLFSKANSHRCFEQFAAGTCWRGWFKLINVLLDLFVFAGCMNASHSASVIGCSRVMEILVDQPPNCAVCSVSVLSRIQKRLMIPLIGWEPDASHDSVVAL